MSFLRNLWTDMVEKKLWPVAVLLLVALVAVPIVIASSSRDVASSASAAVGVSGPTGQTVADAEIALAPGTPVRLDRAGRIRNPFTQQHTGVTAGTGATSAVAVKPTTTGTATTSPPASATPAPSASTTPTVPVPSTTDVTPTPKPQITQDAFTVVLKVGQVDKPAVKRNVHRLTPLPSAVNPFFVYLGVLQDKRTAVFLLSSDVKADGEGKCRPEPTDCQTVELKAGEEELFDVSGDDGEVIAQYRLHLVRVEKDGLTTTAQAASYRARKTTRAGARAAMTSSGSSQYLVDPATGFLRRTSLQFQARKLTRAEARARAVKALELGTAR